MRIEERATAIMTEAGVLMRAPWAPPQQAGIEAELKLVVTSLSGKLNLECQAEFAHYGSGYASFVDAWFFRRDRPFRRSEGVDHWTGLVVLLSRLGPCFCLMEGERAWQSRVGSSYLPSFAGVDLFATPAVEQLSHQVEHELTQRGYLRLRRKDLEAELPSEAVVPTILSDGALRKFDAVFHWED